MTLSEQVAVKLGWKIHREGLDENGDRFIAAWINPQGVMLGMISHYETDIAACFRDIVPKFF